MNILDKYNINPYEYLGVDPLSDINTIKKAYKKKAMVLHPDKTNGKTEAEFKILVLCYKYAKENCITSPVADELTLISRDKEDIPINLDMNIHTTDFEDSSTRSQIFADDQIDFQSFEKRMKRIQNLPTSYSAESFYKKEVLDSMKTKGKFDLDKFNAFFLKLKKEGKTTTDLVRVERVKAANEDDLYMKVNVYDGMVINTDDNDNTNYKENYEVTQKDLDTLLQTDLKTVQQLIAEHKKDTSKIPNKKIKEMIRKKSQNVVVDRTKSFSQLEKDLEIQNMMKIQMEKKKQQEMVDKYKHVYTRSLPVPHRYIN